MILCVQSQKRSEQCTVEEKEEEKEERREKEKKESQCTW